MNSWSHNYIICLIYAHILSIFRIYINLNGVPTCTHNGRFLGHERVNQRWHHTNWFSNPQTLNFDLIARSRIGAYWCCETILIDFANLLHPQLHLQIDRRVILELCHLARPAPADIPRPPDFPKFSAIYIYIYLTCYHARFLLQNLN